jgi:hypothetical protein
LGVLENDNLLLDGDNLLVNYYSGLLDDMKVNINSYDNKKLSFQS